ncbi:MAG TPA: hypothetical protein VGG71_02780 [Chitinophagaceae bacterium]
MRNFYLLLPFLCIPFLLVAQDNYEIQVYGSQTQQKNSAIFELHSNYTFSGEKEVVDGVIPSNQALHETLEITQGITDNFEIGAYMFTNYTPGYGYKVIGTHIRPRIMAPAKWKLPVGLSLSVEVGYQDSAYSDQTWSLEIRPIIDKQWSKLYISFNPTLGIALKSAYSNSTPTFEPNLKAAYSFFKNVALGIEYYGDVGPVNMSESLPQQDHALFIAADMLNNPHWELNAGAGFGLTPATDSFVFKIIVGRRVYWKKK